MDRPLHNSLSSNFKRFVQSVNNAGDEHFSLHGTGDVTEANVSFPYQVYFLHQLEIIDESFFIY